MGGAGGLTVLGTPIGNLADLSPRAAERLRAADVVACEDTRRTATLLRHAGSTARMLPVHRHNEAARAGELVARMADGTRVVLVSDAGMPRVSDPGARLVAAAAAAGIPVEVIPGPSAVTAALAVSGLGAGDGFTFLGFVPRRGGERRAALEALASSAVPVVAFESPQRLPALLADLAERMPERPVAVCRELTKVHEEVLRGTAAELAGRVTAPPKGEIALVVGPAPPATVDEGDAADPALRAALVAMIDAGLGAGRAAELAATLGAAPRNRAYEVAVAIAEERRAAT